MGISIHVGHEASDIEGAEFVVRTAAIHDDNPEIAAARAGGIPVFERAASARGLMDTPPIPARWTRRPGAI